MSPTVEGWNQANPPGTIVRFWGGARIGPGRLSKTASEAYDTQNGPMVRIEGRAGGFLLTHVQPTTATAEDWHREEKLKNIDFNIRELNTEKARIQDKIDELVREKDALEKEIRV